MSNLKGAMTAMLISLILPVVGVALIAAFATGSTVGEDLIKAVGPLILWILPLVAVVNMIGKMFIGD